MQVRRRLIGLAASAAIGAAAFLPGAAGAGVPFELGKLELNTKKGTASIVATIPAFGKVQTAGPKPVAHTQVVGGPGELTLPIKVRKGKPTEQLKRQGRYTVKVDISYVPQGEDQPPGGPSDLFKKITFRLKG